MYKNYIFDLYGTLIDIKTNEHTDFDWAKMAEYYGFQGAFYTKEELKTEFFRLNDREFAKKALENPHIKYVDIELTGVFNELLSLKGVNPEKGFAKYASQFFRITATEYIRLYDGVIDLLESLKKAGKSVYLLSNAQRCLTAPELTMLGLTKYFDGIVISSDEGCCKPDNAFFDVIFKRYGLMKNESIMIGNDYITDIGGAVSYGIDSLYIHQSISPEIKGELKSRFKVMDGDVTKIKKLILN